MQAGEEAGVRVARLLGQHSHDSETEEDRGEGRRAIRITGPHPQSNPGEAEAAVCIGEAENMEEVELLLIAGFDTWTHPSRRKMESRVHRTRAKEMKRRGLRGQE